MGSNGHSETSRQSTTPFPPGIHGPSVTFFLDEEQQEIDWASQERHLEFLITSGLHGVVLGGSSGESVTLTRSEKDQLIRRTREIARRHGKDRYAITVGCLGGCTRDIVEQTRAGHESGADFALVVIPGVFHWAMSQQAIVDFYREVADRSPLPIVIYNIPSIVSGLDVNSDMLATLSAHANISGVKLTCGGVGKITRIAAQTSPGRFAAVCGQSDWLVPALMAGGAGCISGVANLFPTTLLEIYNLFMDGQVGAATALQKQLGSPEWGISTSDVNGMKWIVAAQRGYPESSAHCRRPFPRFSDPEKRARVKRLVAPLVPVEEDLSAKTEVQLC